MKKYLIKSHSSDLEITVTYGEKDHLTGFILSKEVDNAAFLKMQQLFGWVETLSQLQRLYKKYPKLLTEVRETPSFLDFWEAYNYKVDKKRAEEKWKRLKDTDKIKAIAYIKSYDSERATTGAAKMYPKTFLQNELWK